ncbi:MAG: hypothetical protein ABEJ05_00915 [Haloglomus sp.]
MGRVSEFASKASDAIVTPFRLAGRGIGYLIALALIAAAAAVVVAACTFVWVLALFVVDLAVGFPLEPLGVVARFGLPAVVNGVPLVYPLALGVLSSLALGFPSADRETDFSPPIIPP